MTKPSIFDGLRNLFGPIGEDTTKRLEAVLHEPTEKNWDNAYSLIIGGDSMMTLWQAVCAVDPTFPNSAKLRQDNTTVWPRIPDQLTIARAIRYAKKRKTR